jgi:hypothetical protein
MSVRTESEPSRWARQKARTLRRVEPRLGDGCDADGVVGGAGAGDRLDQFVGGRLRHPSQDHLLRAVAE